ncbi:MAG: response regulator transcription factor [Flavobacteriales bacterium]|nr:response regulator transcription factor [Flavobacteriales bacterium]
MKIKILIAEDDVLISEQLNDILLDLGYEVTAIAEDAEVALNSIKQNIPDLAILDIKMHGSDQGLEIAEYINDNLDIPFVFLTAFADAKTVGDASAFNPAAYLVKPFNKQNIYSTLEVVLNNYQSKKQTIIIKNGKLDVKIEVSDILWIKADHVYIEIQTVSKKHVLRTSIDTFLKQYTVHQLQRVHRSYVINIDKVKAVNGQYLIIENEKIPISRKNREEVLAAFFK